MVSFYSNKKSQYFAIVHHKALTNTDDEKLSWLFSNAVKLENKTESKNFIGPRANMISPWSTNAVEITQNMG
ncbi:MAG: hypothetical protein ABR595_09590, partial [Psychroflexus sp.]